MNQFNWKHGVTMAAIISSGIYIYLQRKHRKNMRNRKYIEYMNMNVSQLRLLCSSKKIPNTNKLRKMEMVEVLLSETD